MRAKENAAITALAKSPPRGEPREIYTMGMERVASELGRALGLSMPEVWLEDVDGKPAAVVERIPHTLPWSTCYTDTDVADRLQDRSWWPTGVVFDVWIANLDRAGKNMLVQPLPDGTKFAIADSYELWLIDHGLSGLYWSTKFGVPEKDQPDKVDVGDGEMIELFERNLRQIMPLPYRTAYWADTDAQKEALDRIQSVADDHVDAVVGKIPDAYMSQVERDKTGALLKLRRDRIDNLMNRHW